MENTVTISLFGKEYSVPDTLTVTEAVEHCGYRFIRGCGCRGGFCGACAVIYRIKGEDGIKTCLACQTKVEDGMCIDSLPNIPFTKRKYDMEKITPDGEIMTRIYPEICSCIGCGACTESCPKKINVMKYIEYARSGDIKKCAEESFGCVMCGVCSSRCPAGISHPQVAMLARRVNGKYLSPECRHLNERTDEINEGKFDHELKRLLEMPDPDIKELYENRDMEK